MLRRLMHYRFERVHSLPSAAFAVGHAGIGQGCLLNCDRRLSCASHFVALFLLLGIHLAELPEHYFH